MEVYQFARDAAVAEAWLIAQEPYLMSSELGHTIDEVENLIKKHEAFEKSAAAQEERFSALERLTTVSLVLLVILKNNWQFRSFSLSSRKWSEDKKRQKNPNVNDYKLKQVRFHQNYPRKFLSWLPPISDQRAKEEDAIRKAQAAARDQADAGTPSREEAGKFFIAFADAFALRWEWASPHSWKKC